MTYTANETKTIKATSRQILCLLGNIGFASHEIFDGPKFPMSLHAEDELITAGLVIDTKGKDAYGDIVDGLRLA